MPILCIDTSTDVPVVALADDHGGLVRGHSVDGRAQAVLEAIDRLLQDVDRSTIESVVVGVGPGGFTGLRVGVATARGIADTLGVPLFGVSSLVAAATSAMQVGVQITVVIAAGRGECFVQSILVGTDGAVEELDAVHVVPVDEANAPSPITPNGLARAAGWRRRRATAVAESGNPLDVLPTYVRAPDATPPRLEARLDELTERDLDALLVIEARCFTTPWTRAMYLEELRRPAADAVLLAARDTGANERLVGAAMAHRLGDSWHVMNVLVDPSARGRGIGRKLVVELLERTQALGLGEGWTLEVRDGNDAAIALYERLGFASVGRRPGYYEDTGEDALVMWRREPLADRAEVAT